MSTAPRMARLKSSGTEVFLHPCSVCGKPDAPFGFGVRLLKGELGTWFCGPCRPAKTVAKREVFAPTAQPKPPAAPVAAQAKLF